MGSTQSTWGVEIFQANAKVADQLNLFSEPA